jgi:hypothetical protein
MDAPALTPYEAAIRENIARNRAVMEALGLCRNDACRHEELRHTAAAPKAKRHAKPADADAQEGQRDAVRRSSRLEALAGAPAAADAERDLPLSGGKRKRGADEADCTGDHKAARDSHLRWAGAQRGVSIVGSASYEHTLHRVMTMTEAQLERRMKVIERASGQHAVVKMKLFASVLALEGYTELAEEATTAYQRLVEKLGLPVGAGDGDGDDE